MNVNINTLMIRRYFLLLTFLNWSNHNAKRNTIKLKTWTRYVAFIESPVGSEGYEIKNQR